MRLSALILAFMCFCGFAQGQGNVIVTIAGTGANVHGGDGGQATAASFVYPECICLDKFGNLYVADVMGHRIKKIVLSTGIITTIAGNGTMGFAGDGGAASAAVVSGPQGICVDTFGNIYFGDILNRRIRKITVSTGIINTIAGNGISGISGDGGQATNATFYYPAGLMIDPEGNLIVSDLGNHAVRKITPTGIIIRIAGTGTAGYMGDGGPASSAQLNSPGEVAMDSHRNLFIVDRHSHVIRKVDGVTGVISRISGTGFAGFSGNGGPATAAQLDQPYGIFIDEKDDIYIPEYMSGTIRKIDALTGIIDVVVGCGVGFSGDGGPASGALLQPSAVCIGDDGIMYIADLLNYRIRMVYNSKLETELVLSENEVMLYPNPATEELVIEHAAGSEVCIYDVMGRCVRKFGLTTEKEVLDIHDINSGIYVVHIMGENGLKLVRTIVKQK